MASAREPTVADLVLAVEEGTRSPHETSVALAHRLGSGRIRVGGIGEDVREAWNAGDDEEPPRRRGRGPPEDARFEYRIFAPRLDEVEQRLRALAEEGDDEAREEIYLVGARPDRNVKVRDGAIEVKALREERHGLERWEPLPAHELPVEGDWVRDALASHLGLERLTAPREAYDLDTLAEEVIEPTRDVTGLRVRKERRHFSADGARAELTRVELAGRTLQTAAVESADVREASRWVRRLGLDAWPNTSYVRCIQQCLAARRGGPSPRPNASRGSRRGSRCSSGGRR